MNPPVTVLVPADRLPEEWKSRAHWVAQVTLLPSEAAGLFAEETVRPGLSDEEIRIARLLLEGLTLQAVARRSGISLRTLQRRLAELRAKAGVSSTRELVRVLDRLAGGAALPPGGPRPS